MKREQDDIISDEFAGWLQNVLLGALIIALLAMAIVCGGCVQTRVKSPDGWEFERTTFLNKTTAGEVVVPISGTNAVVIRNYANDSVTAAAVITEAAVSAAIKSAKP